MRIANKLVYSKILPGYNVLKKNVNFKSHIGNGFYETFTPIVLKQNFLNNPSFYSAYTPYQSEISQGNLELMYNYQTLIQNITKKEISNSGLLDNGHCAIEILNIISKQTSNPIFVNPSINPNLLRVIQSNTKNKLVYEYNDNCGAVINQCPDTLGNIKHYASKINVVFTDLMFCIKHPYIFEYADYVCGNSQRFGIPMNYGGPFPSFMATDYKNLRFLPGKISSISKDARDNSCFRLGYQAREQHVKKDKALSNICTSQTLLSNYNYLWSIYNGGEMLDNISQNIYEKTKIIKENTINMNNNNYYDTLLFKSNDRIKKECFQKNILFNFFDDYFTLSINETDTNEDINNILNIINNTNKTYDFHLENNPHNEMSKYYPNITETELLRYMKKLENNNFSLTNNMMPLGSCTMKLNSSHTLKHIWDKKLNIHPYAPSKYTNGYTEFFKEFEKILCELTGFDNVCFEAKSGAMGEYNALNFIKSYNQGKKYIMIPEYAHGTNFASAKMAGYDIIKLKTKCGEIDRQYFSEMINTHKNNIAGIMITYPSTYGIFDNIQYILDTCQENNIIRYLDGANMNALLGTKINNFDVCHLNLHKTFGIPHGGGGPGGGVICMKNFLYQHKNHYISDVDYGNAGVYLISYEYIRLVGIENMKYISEKAIENSKYLIDNLKNDYTIKYLGNNSHEFIIDCSVFDDIKDIDISKRLMDYNFYPPTMSWPIPNSLMIEPTESESTETLDQFISAMKSIRNEIDNNPDIIKNAPHTMNDLMDWNYHYHQKEAFYPLDYLYKSKFIPSCNRVNDIYGDRLLLSKIKNEK